MATFTYIDEKYIKQLSSYVDRFKDMGNNTYNCRCPYCGDSQKSLLKARGYFYVSTNGRWRYKCHNCAKSTNLAGLIEHVDPLLYKEYIMERYMDGDTGRRKVKEPTFNIPATRFDKLEKKKV